MHRQHNACNVNYVQCCLIHCPQIFLKFKSISYSKDSVQWCIQFATVISLSGWFIGLSCQSSRDKLRCRPHPIHQAWTKQFHVTDGYLIMFRILYQKTPVIIAVEILLICICTLYVSYLIVNVYPGMPTLGEQQHPFWMLHTFIWEHQNWISSIIYIYIYVFVCACVCVVVVVAEVRCYVQYGYFRLEKWFISLKPLLDMVSFMRMNEQIYRLSSFPLSTVCTLHSQIVISVIYERPANWDVYHPEKLDLRVARDMT